MNENIKKFEYYIFIKKLKKKIYVKNLIKTNIILFQKRSAMDQLLTNVIFKMKTDIMKEKIKNLLIKKFIYKLMTQYIENYKPKNSDVRRNNNNNVLGSLENQRKLFNNFLLKLNAVSFFKKIKVCLNNTRIRNIQENIFFSKKFDNEKIFFQKVKIISIYEFSKRKKIFFEKLFFQKIKYITFNKSKDINYIDKLKETKKIFIYKINFHLFINNCNYIKNKINEKNTINKKIGKFKEDEGRNTEMKKYFKIFITKVRISKQSKDSLKRKIFNIIKKNLMISKELKHYLNEAEEIK